MIEPANATGPYAKVFEARSRHELDDFGWPPALRLRTLVEYGEPVHEILRFASAETVDWIVMGISHDFPWWSTHNNHAYQVVAESECPVLTFHNRILARPQIEQPLSKSINNTRLTATVPVGATLSFGPPDS